MVGFRVFALASIAFTLSWAQTAAAAAPHAAAEALMYQASDAVAHGDNAGAIDALKRCVQVDKAYPKCPRILAILYGKQGEQKKAATYYRVYLKEAPKAPDAAAVRDLVREYEAN